MQTNQVASSVLPIVSAGDARNVNRERHATKELNTQQEQFADFNTVGPLFGAWSMENLNSQKILSSRKTHANHLLYYSAC